MAHPWKQQCARVPKKVRQVVAWLLIEVARVAVRVRVRRELAPGHAAMLQNLPQRRTYPETSPSTGGCGGLGGWQALQEFDLSISLP